MSLQACQGFISAELHLQFSLPCSSGLKFTKSSTIMRLKRGIIHLKVSRPGVICKYEWGSPEVLNY